MKIYVLFSKQTIWLAMFLLFSTSFLKAQETQDLLNMSLEDLMNIEVTTASKSSQKSGMAPATITVVTAEQIKLRGYQGLGEVLEDLPGIVIQNNTASESGNNVLIRGLGSSEKFIILLDGIKISSPTGEVLGVMNNYPVNLAKQIEIIYGPASALYGADAVTGVINIITNKTDQGLQATISGGIYTSVNGTLFYNRKLGEKSNITLSGQYFYDKQAKLYEKYPEEFSSALTSLQSGTFNTSWGFPMSPKAKVSPDFEMPVYQYNLFASLTLDKFTFSYFGNFHRQSSSLNYTGQDAIYNKDVYFGQYLNIFSGAYTDNINDNILSSTSLTLSRYDMDPESNYRNIYVDLEPGYKYSFGTMMKAEQQLSFKINDELSLIGGGLFESYYTIPKGTDLEKPIDVSKAVQGIIRGTVMANNPSGIEADFYTVRYYNAGGYIQAQYVPSEVVSITLGGRYDYNSRYEGSFNPRLGIVVKPTERTTIKALYGSAFLAASPYQAYQCFGSFQSSDSGRTYTSGFWHLPNPGLNPIKAQTFELGVRSYLSDELGITVNGFYSIYTDLFIGASDAGNTNLYGGKYKGWNVGYIETTINQGKQYNFGGELLLDYLMRINEDTRITSYASVSFVDGYVDTKADNGNDIEIGNIVPVMVKAGADIVFGKFSISPRIIYNGKSRVNSLVIENGKTTDKRKTIDGYFIVNANIKYMFSENISVFTNIYNMLDARYYTISETFKKGWPQMPINLKFGIEYKL